MKALIVNYDNDSDSITPIADAEPRNWQDICEAHDDDVHRLRDVGDHPGYTGLYVCYDAGNRPHHFLVEEDEALQRMKRRTFFKKLGR